MLYDFDPETRQLSLFGQVAAFPPLPGPTIPVYINPSGKWMLLSITDNTGNPPQWHEYSIDTNSGQLSEVQNFTAPPEFLSSTMMTFDPSGKYIYSRGPFSLNSFLANLYGFAFDPRQEKSLFCRALPSSAAPMVSLQLPRRIKSIVGLMVKRSDSGLHARSLRFKYVSKMPCIS